MENMESMESMESMECIVLETTEEDISIGGLEDRELWNP